MYTIPEAFDEDYRIKQVATLGKMPPPFMAWHQITLQDWSKQEKSLSFSTHVDRSLAVWRNDSPNSLCNLLREKEDNAGRAKHSPFLLHWWIRYVQGPLSAGFDALWSGDKQGTEESVDPTNKSMSCGFWGVDETCWWTTTCDLTFPASAFIFQKF